MLRQVLHEIKISTRDRGLYEFTEEISAWVSRNGFQTGLVSLHLQHTSASLLIQENADPDVRRDLNKFFERLVPEDSDYFVHTTEGPDDSTSHIRMVLTRTSETVPIIDGKMQLGTWQGIFLFEHRRAAHRRKISVTIIGE